MIVRIDRDGSVKNDENTGILENLVVLDMGRSHAMEYMPECWTVNSHVAVVIMHCDQNYMGLAMGPALAKRGYHVLACESYKSGGIDERILLLDSCMRYLRQKDEIDKIILMGHSGGATLMTAYQSIAENGPQIYQGKDMIWKCTLSRPTEPADGLMLIDANYGNGIMTLLSLDPAVEEEGNGMKLNPEFDIFSPQNGYDPKGAHYSLEFIRKYQIAQAKRNNRLIDFALDRLDKIQNGRGRYVDDEPFCIAAADQPKPNNRLIPEDMRLLSHTKGCYDLLYGDGTVNHEQIYCVRTPECDHSFSSTYEMGADKTTIKSFLSSQAIRTSDNFAVTSDDIIGAEWKSSYASPIGNIEDVSVPALIMGMTGNYEYLASEMIYEHAAMKDKSIAFVRGAGHMFSPNHAAEKIPGEFMDTETILYDYMAKWLNDRFV